MPATHAQHQRTIRKEALREQLSKQGHIQHAVDIATKFNEEIDRETQDRLKTKFDMHMKLVNKYLPDVKQTEINLTGEEGGPIKTVVEFVRPQD